MTNRCEAQKRTKTAMNSLSAVTLSFGSLDGTLIWMLSAFAWALYVERCAPYNLRLGALRVMAWTTLIGSPNSP